MTCEKTLSAIPKGSPFEAINGPCTNLEITPGVTYDKTDQLKQNKNW